MAGEAKPLKVFVSYSRADVAFADQLVLALEDKGFEAILDRHDISGAENWRERLGKLILSGDAVTFVLTEKSATSEICKWEVREANTLGKRIIPITPGPLGSVTPPEELAELNWIPFYADPAIPGSGFYYGVVRLNEALSVDLEWLRAQTRYSERAVEWAKHKAEDLLLRGEALREAEAWLARTPVGAHPPDRVREYLAASGDVEQHRQAAAKVQLQEREQALKTAEAAVAESRAAQGKLRRFSVWALAAGVVLLAIAIPGNYFAATRTLDANDRRAALFADAANDLSRQGDYSRALLMALAGDPPARVGFLESVMRPDGNMAVRDALARAYANDASLTSHETDKEGRSLVGLGDGERFVTFAEDGTAQLWKVDADMKGETLSLPYPAQAGFATADGDTLILQPKYGVKEPACAWSLKQRAVVRCYGGKLGDGVTEVASVTVDPGAAWVVVTHESELAVWNTADATLVGKTTLPFPAIDAVAASSDDDFVVASRGDDVVLWRVSTQMLVGPMSSSLGDVKTMVASNDVGVIFGTESGQVGSVDADTGKPTAAFQTFSEELTRQEGVAAIRMTPSARALLLISTEGRFKVLDLLSAVWEEPFGARADIVSADYLDKAGLIVGLTQSGAILMSSFEARPEAKHFPEMLGVEPTQVGDGLSSSFVVKTRRGQVVSDLAALGTRVWDPATREVTTFPTASGKKDDHGTTFVSVSEDSAILLRAMSGELQVWKKGATAPASTTQFLKEEESLKFLQALPKGDAYFYITGKGGDESFAGVRKLEGAEDIHPPHDVFGDMTIVSRDGMLIADAATRSVEIYKPGQTDSISIATPQPVRAIAFSPDATMITIGQEGGLVSIWRIGDTRPLQTIKAHKESIKDVVFHPGGQLLVTTGEDGRLMVWKVGERDPVQVIRLPPVEPEWLAIDHSGRYITLAMEDDQRIFPIDPILLADVDTQVKMACERLEQRGVKGFSDQDYAEYSFIGKFDDRRDRDPCVKLGMRKAAPAPAKAPAAKAPSAKITAGN